MEAIPLIVVACNRPDYTRPCLDALYSVDHGAPIWPVVVDNGSLSLTRNFVEGWAGAHGSLPQEARARVSPPAVVRLARNGGFAAGLNAGLARVLPSRPAWVAVMHNDCIPFRGWLGEMAACAQGGDEDVAVLSPRTNYANEMTPCLKDVRERFEAAKPNNKTRLLPEDLEAVMAATYPGGQEALLASLAEANPRTRYSPEICSFCMLVKASMFEQFGGFDEDFWPRGWEDKFWFRRPERAGYCCAVANRAFVQHAGNVSSDGPGFCFPEIMRKNEELFKAKAKAADERDAQERLAAREGA